MAENSTPIKIISLEDLSLYQSLIKEYIDGVDKELTQKVNVLNGAATVDGSVAKQVATAKQEVEAKIGDTSKLETTEKTELVKAINEVRNAVSAGGTAAAITLTSGEVSDGVAKSYVLKQGDNTIGTIDIPKDLVVESGSVVTLADGDVEGYAAGTYIKLVLANSGDVLYINVGTLVDIYKAHANATQVQITVDSSTREISAVIVAGSIGTTELADGAVTTVKIADGNVTKAKLHSDVVALLDKAGTALQPADIKDLNDASHTHDNKSLLDTYTQTEANLKDAVDKKHTHDNASVLNGISSEKVAAWDAAEQNAKTYVDNKFEIASEDDIRALFTVEG